MRCKTIVTSMCFMILGLAPAFADDAVPLVRSISTSGRGEVRVVPDNIVVSFGVTSRSKNLDFAKRDNDERTGKVLALVGEFGLDAEHVQTSSMEIQPRYKSDYADVGAGEFIGYSVNKQIVFVLQETERLTSLVSEALKAGADTINGVSLGTTESRKYADQARVLAIRAAREKAELLAGTLGMSIGFPLSITEDTDQWSGRQGRGSNRGLQILEECDVENDSSETPTFALGMISITAEVSVEFEMTPKAAEPQSTETHAESDTHGSAAAASASAAVTRDAHEGPGEITSPYGGNPSSVQ